MRLGFVEELDVAVGFDTAMLDIVGGEKMVVEEN